MQGHKNDCKLKPYKVILVINGEIYNSPMTFQSTVKSLKVSYVNYKYTEKYTNRTVNIFSYIVISNSINVEKTPLGKVMKRILIIVNFLILIAKPMI